MTRSSMVNIHCHVEKMLASQPVFFSLELIKNYQFYSKSHAVRAETRHISVNYYISSTCNFILWWSYNFLVSL